MKVLKIAAVVVAIAAAAVFGGPILGMLALAATASVISSSLIPKPSVGGQQTRWKADPYAGVPYVMGRTLVGGNIVYRRGHGTNNKYETFVTVLALGTIASIDTTFANRTTVSFNSAGGATGTYANSIWQRSQLGASPEAVALTSPVTPGPPGWTAAHKLSGLAVALNTFAYDAKGKTTFTTEPRMGWIVHGALVYDPRMDSTYPGGSGPCRALDESTYVWSENPHLHGLTWTLGRWQNGKRVAGIGAPIARIDVPSFVEGANLDDARGWTVGGQVYTRPDTPWNSLKSILQAGGAQPVMVGGTYSCINRAPRVSLATIGPGDIVGRASFAGTQPRRTRLNGIIPQYRSEAHDWEMVPAKGVIVPEYVAMDGDERTKEIAYPLVQDVDQVTQLAAYDICDGREAGPGTLPLKPAWFNYRVGDCLTFAPEEGWSTKIQVVGRAPDASAGTVTYTVRTETDAKHAFALGKTGTAPPTASFSYDESIAAPAEDWIASGVTLSANGVSIPAVVLAGEVGNDSAEAVVIEYRLHEDGLATDDGWIGATLEAPTITRKEITSVTPGTSYDVSVRYRVRGIIGNRAVFRPVEAGSFSVGLRRLISRSVAYPLTSDDDSIAVEAFTGVLSDGASVAFPATTLTGLSAGTTYGVFLSADGTYSAVPSPAEAEVASPELIFVGWQSTSDGGTYPDPEPAPGGWGGSGYYQNAY